MWSSLSSGSPGRLSRRSNNANAQKYSAIRLSSVSSNSGVSTVTSTTTVRSMSTMTSTSTAPSQVIPITNGSALSTSPSRLSTLTSVSTATTSTCASTSPKGSRRGSFIGKLFKTKSNDPNITSSTTALIAPSPSTSTLPGKEFKPASGISLSHAAVVFKFVASIGDGAINVPGLKAAAQIAGEIVRIAQRTKENSEACLIIAEQACQLIKALALGLQNNAATLDDTLVTHIEEFTNDLKSIQSILTKIQARKLHQRALHTDDDAGDIATCRDILTRSTELFQVKGQVQGYLNWTETKAVNKVILQMGAHILGEERKSAPVNLLISSTPPPLPVPFVGRGDIVAEAVKTITSSPGSNIAILGSGGMGKTALSLGILHHDDIKQKFQDKRFFVPCDAIKTPDALVTSILHVLGVDDVGGKDPLSKLDGKCKSCGPLFIILDNFESPWNECSSNQEIHAVLCRLASLDCLTLLITMRGIVAPPDIAWAPLLPSSGLPMLSPEAAKEMFLAMNASQCPDTDQEIQALDILLKELDYIPLAIKLISPLKAMYSFEELLERWKEEKNELLVSNQSNANHRLSNIDVSIEMSLKYLGSDSLTCMQVLAVISHLPNGVSRWTSSLAKMIPGVPKVHNPVTRLCAASLLHTVQGSLKMLSPIRNYIRQHHSKSYEQDITNLEVYYRNIISSYLDNTYDVDIVRKMAMEQGNIIDLFVTRLKSHPSQHLVLAALLYSKFLLHVQPTEALIINVIQVLVNVGLGDQLPECHLHHGNALYMQSKYPQAIVIIQKAQTRFSVAADKNGMARCLRSLGHILRMQNEYQKATEKLEAAQALFDEIGDEQGVAQCLLSLGNIMRMQNAYEEAKVKLETAYAQFEKSGYQLGMAQCVQSLGNILKMQKRLDEAMEKLQAAFSMFHTLGDRLGMAQCSRAMGGILKTHEKYEEAIARLETAQEHFGFIGSQHGMAHCLHTLGEILQTRQEYEKAMTTLEDAHSKFSFIGERLGIAQCLQSQGEILQVQNESFKAREKINAAYTIYTKINYQHGIAACLQLLQQAPEVSCN